MTRIANKEAKAYVNRREVFETTNKTMYALQKPEGRYAVYSYGSHFPMYVYDAVAGQWFGNADKYSVTTSRHQSQARPDVDDIMWLDTDQMRHLAKRGYVNACADRIIGDANG